MTTVDPESRALRPPEQPLADAPSRSAAFNRDRPLFAVLGVQVVWLWWAFSRGWFLQADLSNLADGVERPFGWHYLSEPLGGHFAPLNRLVYWLLDQLGALDYSYTVAFRVGCQALATLLLYLVLVELVGRQPVVIAILAAYALNPVLLGGGAWFTSGVGLIPAQALALLSIWTYLRYERTRRVRLAAYTGLFLGLTVLASDQWVVAALVPPLLALTHLYPGGPLARVRELISRWRAWLLIFGPLIAALAAVLLLGNSQGASRLTAGQGYDLVRESWVKTLAPSWAGGPWRWINGPGVYISYAGPPDWMVLLGELAVLVTLVLGVRRLGLGSLLGWVMPVICGAVSVLIIGFGRYSTYGDLIAVTPRYLFQTIALFAIGAALALAPVAGRPVRQHGQPLRFDRLQTVIGVLAVALIVAASLVSGARFAERLGKSPVRDYVANLEAGVRTRGSQVNLWDTAVPQDVISGVEPNHRVSDLLRLVGVHARFDDPSSEPLIVTGDGHLAPAVFVPAAEGIAPPGDCGTFVHGVGTVTIPLTHALQTSEWFLRLVLYQAQPSEVSVEVLDAAGNVARPLSGSTVELGTLEARNLALPAFAPAAVRIASASATTNLCLSRVAVGGPFASTS